MGLSINNPIVVGSSGLSSSIEKIEELEKSGVGAIVLKSLFEEQIISEINYSLGNSIDAQYPEAYDYVSRYTKQRHIDAYLNLIEDAKKKVSIPIIASINCVSDSEWISFATKIQEAGADGIELNISLLPSDASKDSIANEKIYFDIISSIKQYITIPIGIKMNNYSAGLANLIQRISWTKSVDNVVLFNRYYCPDIDIDNVKVVPTVSYSTYEEIKTSLRWVALMSGEVDFDIVAATGIHDYEGVIKQLLAGAQSVQIVSEIYKSGPQIITNILKGIVEWMQSKGYNSIDEFRGKLSVKDDVSGFERIQFMKYYGGIE